MYSRGLSLVALNPQSNIFFTLLSRWYGIESKNSSNSLSLPVNYNGKWNVSLKVHLFLSLFILGSVPFFMMLLSIVVCFSRGEYIEFRAQEVTTTRASEAITVDNAL